MRTLTTTAFGFLIAFFSAQSVFAKEWRGIMPLRSVRSDVERLLGPPSQSSPHGSYYSLPDELAVIHFQSISCKDSCGFGWNVPIDTVISIGVIPKGNHRKEKFDTGGDFKVATAGAGFVYYTNEHDGLFLEKHNGTLTLITYSAAETEAAALRCPPIKECIIDFFPKFDEYGHLSFEDEKARLDNYVIQMKNMLGRGAIVVVGENRAVRDRLLKRAERAKRHLVQKRGFEAERLLIVARILQELGAAIVVEAINPDGRRPDFRVQFPDAAVTVEAKAPIFDAPTGDELKNRIPLLNFIESKVPSGWRVCVYELPNIGPADSRKNFERTVQQMLNVPPPREDDTDTELSAELPTGIIHLHLFPTNLNNQRLGWEAPISLVDNSRERILLAVKRKRRQVRNSQTPVLLAIQASGICSDFEHFDIALFGSGYDRYDEHHRLAETGFMPNGIFSNRSDKAPVFAGVLAFLTVGFNTCIGPVLYRHPRFSETLPEALLQLEQRTYSESINKIQVEPSKVPDLINRLNLVNV